MNKYCPKCDTTKTVDNFTKNSGKSDGLQSYCRECMKAVRLKHYQNNKQAHYDRNMKARAQAKQYILELKNATPCAQCGVRYPGEPWLMEFDHLPEFTKDKGISVLASTYGLHKKLKEELAKCELLCVVCHRRRTAERGGWLDNRLAHLLD